MRLKMVPLIVLVAITAVFTAPAGAGDWNKATTAIFNQPVQIPGQVLPPGIYVFKLAEMTDRNVVQIWNAEETQLVATLLGWPEYLRTTPQENTFVLERRELGEPAILKSWFHRGNSHGQSFNYPKQPSRAIDAPTK